MNRRITLVLFMLAAFAHPAIAAPKDCEELKAEIAAKIDAKGVKPYTLTIIESGAAADGTVVGSCQAGTKQIVYKRG